MTWQRPIPLIGDTTSAAQRASDVSAWAFSAEARNHFYDVVAARRDVRRFRPDDVPVEVLERVLTAAHQAPSVGHSQPWRFITIRDPRTRDRAARMADEQRLKQARMMEPDAGRRLLDLQLEGIREAPLGIVVACDRRVPAGGVLGRATFPDADLWSCACAVENLWLAARSEGLGVGWVTLFEPDDLAELVEIPAGVETLGWLCVGWPDERPPAPGLERAGWSRRQPVVEVVMSERWAEGVSAPTSHLQAPGNHAVVGVRDDADSLLTPPGSLGVLDRAIDRVISVAAGRTDGDLSGQLLVAVGRHRVVEHGVSAYPASVTDEVLAASRAGESAGAAAAAAGGLDFWVVDAGSSTGDLLRADALSAQAVAELLERGRDAGRAASQAHALLALGEVGIGNTTVAAALTAALLGLPAAEVVGLGAGSDAEMLARKTEVVAGALKRLAAEGFVADLPVERVLQALGGPEFCVLAGAILGAAAGGAVCVLDGLATSVAALIAVKFEPGAAAYLVAGQRSRERAHSHVLEYLGLEPLLDLRLRSGEGVGAALGANLMLTGLQLRRLMGRTEG